MSHTSRKLSRLSKQSHIALGGLVAGAGIVGAASGANADAIGLQIYDINETAKEGSFRFDLNKDGRDDFRVFSDGDGPGEKGFAEIKGFKTSGGNKVMAMPGRELGKVLDEITTPTTTRGKVALNPWQSIGDNFVQRFEASGEVTGASGDFQGKGTFYDDSGDDGIVVLAALDDGPIGPNNTGPFSKVGDIGYIGLSLTVSREFCCDFEQGLEILEEGMDRVHMGNDEYIEEGPLVFYGWAEVVRGSLTVSRIGFQSTAFAAAPIPPGGSTDIPEPATLPLLALGAAGLAAMRRRKAVAA